MQEIENEVPCDFCGSTNRNLITVEYTYPISKCVICGFVYVSQIPNVVDGKVLGEYYSEDRAEIDSCRERYNGVSKFLIREIMNYKSGGKLLDVGCGYGFFLVEARENGWDVYGTELSEVAVEYLKTEQNLPNVLYSDLSGSIFDDVKFDAINLTNVLEHVPSPTKLLTDCRKLLAKDGVITIRVPNMEFNSLKHKLLPVLNAMGLGQGGELCYLASPPPYHLSGFNSQTLGKYFAKVGLEQIEIKPSRLSSTTRHNFIYRLFELFVQLLYQVTFRRINISPTILAIARSRTNS